MSKIIERLHDLLHDVALKFETLGHPAAAELRALHTRLHAGEHQLAGDARHVEADAEHAAGPVVAEVKHDGEQLATEAAAAVTSVTEPAAQPPAAATA